MAYLQRGNARIYYEERGSGEPVVAIHGLIENNAYWTLAGVADTLARHFRLISMEMRGHGRTLVEGEPKGFDDETMADDLIALADSLGLGRFHVLAHSTGGFIAVRRAMKESGRFASLALTDTASFTSAVDAPAESIRKYHDRFAAGFEKLSWEQMFAVLRNNPGPFFRGIAESDRKEELFALAQKMAEMNDRFVIASFIRSFYTDADQRIEGLRKIACPALVVCGEKDDLFIQPSRLMAREIPGARIIEYPGVGHMTAIEAPERLAEDIISFVREHPAGA